MARAIAFAVVVSLVISTSTVVLYRYFTMRESLEVEARYFCSLVHVPLVQISLMYDSVGINDIIEARVDRLLHLNSDVREVQIIRGNGSVAFSATRDRVRLWPFGVTAPSVDDLALREPLPERSPIGERVRVNGRSVYRVVVPSERPHEPWSMSLVATFGYDQVNRQLWRGLALSAIALAVGLLVTHQVSRALARGITRNLDDLHAGVRRIRAGRLEDRVDIHSDDEIEELASAFNEMTDELQQTIGRLRSANRELQTIDETKSNLLANVSHELRTPLTALKGFLELLEDGELGRLGDRAARAVSVCRRNVDRLALRVEDLVQLSHVETPWPASTMTGPVAVDAIIRLAVEIFEPRFRAKSHRVEVDVSSELPRVEGNSEQLERVVLNLVDNAIKFTPDGGSIRISAEECDHDGRAGVLMRIVDTGIGIPVGEEVRIFDRFHQVDPSIRRRFGGMGLGLALVHHTVEAHSGVVWVESEEGEGSSFFVWLPCSTHRQVI
ncbi:MAG: HAMP domain-containing sensor histidine kinase [Holophagae bacterium]|jgi:signal transduction histidine kinase